MSSPQSLSGSPHMFKSIALTMPERYAQNNQASASANDIRPPGAGAVASSASPVTSVPSRRQAAADDNSDDFVSTYYDAAGDDDDGDGQPTTQTYLRQLTVGKSAADMSGIEQTLEYFDWTGRSRSRGLEQQIIDELQLVDNATVYSMVLPDNRTADLVSVLDRAIDECWDLERKLGVYKVQLQTHAENFKAVNATKAQSTVRSMLDPAPK
ncbi:hypothetical protein V1525DRAFT_347519 [Lipomyces kononenkoae]|uniref:Uncharacterized protein n=1 Tax=Lipomyces kononenkoae TaxID=34357 RepID=A0ACC3SX07_LIPKO